MEPPQSDNDVVVRMITSEDERRKYLASIQRQTQVVFTPYGQPFGLRPRQGRER